jgi:hypothetical protein
MTGVLVKSIIGLAGGSWLELRRKEILMKETSPNPNDRRGFVPARFTCRRWDRHFILLGRRKCLGRNIREETE